MTMATMKLSGNEPSTTPLPHASRRSTLKLLSRCFSDSVPDLSSDDFHGPRKAVDRKKEWTENSSVRSSGSSRLEPSGANDKRKKTVRFQSNMTLLCEVSDAPRASETSSLEKDIRWYGAADFDRFKREAAADAGVTVVRSEDSHHFVLAGDFDCPLNGFCNEHGATSGTTARRAYYNENEYDDSPTACRRGLGHHFSRTRKRSRAAARAAVAAWQETLLAGVAEEEGPGRGERTRLLTLALISSRCSRTAREEARWRGDVDYRVAHPGGRRAADAEAPSATPSVHAEGGNGGPAESAAGNKRDRAPVVAASRDGAERKRRRTSDGGLSPVPVTFAGRMLHIRAEA